MARYTALPQIPLPAVSSSEIHLQTTPNAPQIDPAFLAAMPADIRAELTGQPQQPRQTALYPQLPQPTVAPHSSNPYAGVHQLLPQSHFAPRSGAPGQPAAAATATVPQAAVTPVMQMPVMQMPVVPVQPVMYLTPAVTTQPAPAPHGSETTIIRKEPSPDFRYPLLWPCSVGSRMCCTTFICPCVPLGDSYAATNPKCSPCSAKLFAAIALCVSPFCFIPFTAYTRCQVREKYKIAGHPFLDMLASVLCPACVICQMGKEVEDTQFEMRSIAEGVVPPGVKLTFHDDATSIEMVSSPSSSSSSSSSSSTSASTPAEPMSKKAAKKLAKQAKKAAKKEAKKAKKAAKKQSKSSCM
eukprot:gnl/Spiro4/9457_TR5007_c0_g1_i1.p1 gnl/Spiro4/9457_TR5007_c0_g1~~gnl/Spiro4/9457_TR5007_c0_g1_i1.p1  ORF type:complete len:355 (+),score=96.78 gnl/Spiro4/9457_TR5007_c0_g1_i1:58-1122(+)